jgi:hypothetical protein
MNVRSVAEGVTGLTPLRTIAIQKCDRRAGRGYRPSEQHD